MTEWGKIAADVVHHGGHVVQFLAGLLVIAFGLWLLGVSIYGLALPDADLVKSYVGLIAGAKAGVAAASVPQRMIGAVDVVPVLAPVVIGVRLVLVAVLMIAVWIVSEGWKFWR
jgi:hypothetical protein